MSNNQVSNEDKSLETVVKIGGCAITPFPLIGDTLGEIMSIPATASSKYVAAKMVLAGATSLIKLEAIHAVADAAVNNNFNKVALFATLVYSALTVRNMRQIVKSPVFKHDSPNPVKS